MAKINLDTEPRFKAMMKELGFKKSKGEFVRMHNEACLRLSFSYATQNEKFVRYYYGSFSINYPKVIEEANKIDEYVYGPNGHIGYLMPQDGYVDWRLAEDDSDDYYINIINEIVDAEEKYVIPYLEKLSTIRSFVDSVESGTMRFSYDRKTMPIAYLLLGEKDNALKYINNHLYKLAHNNEIGRLPEIIVGEDYVKEISYPQENRALINYQEFAEKFKNVLLGSQAGCQ